MTKCAPIPRKKLRALEKCVQNKGTPGDYYCTETAKKTLKSLDLQFLGEGISRSVYALGKNCVLKIAEGRLDVADNLAEIKGWEWIKSLKQPNVEQMFAPVVSHASNGAWLVMERAHKIGRLDRDDMRYALQTAGIVCHDIHARNIGELNGRPVVIDYAELKCDLRR